VDPAPRRGPARLVHGHRAHSPRLAHRPPPRRPDPSVRPEPDAMRGMSQRCHGDRRTTRRPGPRTCPTRDATVTEVGAGYLPNGRAQSPTYTAITPSPLLPAARGCSASDARDAVSSALVDLIHRSRRTDG
jgi:hypothetical protein